MMTLRRLSCVRRQLKVLSCEVVLKTWYVCREDGLEVFWCLYSRKVLLGLLTSGSFMTSFWFECMYNLLLPRFLFHVSTYLDKGFPWMILLVPTFLHSQLITQLYTHLIHTVFCYFLRTIYMTLSLLQGFIINYSSISMPWVKRFRTSGRDQEGVRCVL
jgi:hypothetical protein